MNSFVPLLLCAFLLFDCLPCKAQDWSRLEVEGKEVLILRDEFGGPHLKSPEAPILFEAWQYKPFYFLYEERQ